MTALDGTSQVVTLALGLAGLIAAIYALFRWLGPKLQQGEAVGAAILGRPERLDRAGRQMEPAVPGLVAQVDEMRGDFREMKQALELIADSHLRIESLEKSRRDHADRIDKLESASFERAVTRAESAHAWRAVAALAADEDAELP